MSQPEILSPNALAWRKFKQNRLAMIGAFYVLLLVLVSLLGPLIRPDSSPNANAQSLSIAMQKPGFSVDLLSYKDQSQTVKIPVEKVTAHEPFDISATLFTSYPLPEAEKEKISISRKDVIESNEGWTERSTFLLGTDKYGRDFLSRLMAGSSISLGVGAIAVLVSLFVGLVLGALAGFFRGWIDRFIMWFINVVWSIPTLLLVMAITLAFGKGIIMVFIAVGLTMWVEVARVVRGQVLTLRNKEFVEAGRALGFSNGRILFKHILPNVIGPIIVISAANFAAAILIEAGLSFLGIGAQIPTPSWGNIIKEHYSYITTDNAYLAILPGLLIMSLVLAFMLVGNGLRDALDPKNV